MTREEAIKIMSQMIKDEEGFLSDNTVEAHKMAIKALEQEPCEDCVSREALMHILDEVGGDFDSPREAVVPIDYIADMVSELPSVTPKPCGDCISREETLKALMEEWTEYDKELIGWLFEKIDKLPSVTPHQKVGYWEWNQYDANPKIGNFHCSLCHSIGRSYFDYCPYCGAKMEVIPNETDY